MVDYLTLMLITMTAGLVVLAHYVYVVRRPVLGHSSGALERVDDADGCRMGYVP